MSDKISVVMSTYDTPVNYLNEAICSILEQTYSNIEFVIICDGSEKEYQYILANYKDERMKVLLNRQNRGLAYSLNRGISESSGRYIARMDSDDISLPDRLERELDYLKRKKLDLCSSAVYPFGDRYGRKVRLFNSREDIRVSMLFMATLMHPTVIGKREVFEKNKYNEDYICAQDFELWSRLIDGYNIGYYDKPLLMYRIHEKQATVEKKKIQYEMARRIIEKNASKINGEYDEKIFKCLWLLGGREKITKTNYQEFSQLIDYTLGVNNMYKKYDEKSMKRIFNNRFFELMIKYKVFTCGLPSIKKLLHFYNLEDLAIYCLNKVSGKIRQYAMIKGEGKTK